MTRPNLRLLPLHSTSAPVNDLAEVLGKSVAQALDTKSLDLLKRAAALLDRSNFPIDNDLADDIYQFLEKTR